VQGSWDKDRAVTGETLHAAMRPDAHKKARARQYQKANPTAAAVAAERRQTREGEDDEEEEGAGARAGAALGAGAHPPPLPHDTHSHHTAHHADARSHHRGRDHGAPAEASGGADAGLPGPDSLGMLEGGNDDDAADLEDMLTELDGTDGSSSHFRFRAEGALDPVALLASAGFIGATDALADRVAPKSCLWPDMGTLAAELATLPLHRILGVPPSELSQTHSTDPLRASDPAAVGKDGGLVGGAAEGAALDPSGRDAVGAPAAQTALPTTPPATLATDADGHDDGGESDNLEDWLDSVL
jgi:hypothetical protein